MLKENLTLFFAVRDRQYNIPVVMEYYADLDCRKLIVDQSKEEYKGQIAPGFKYIFIGPTRWFDMMYWISHQVDTPYILDATDDDLYWKPGIKKAIEFLVAHPDYSSCEGITKKISKKGETGCVIANGPWPAQQVIKETLWYEKYNTFERMIDFMTCYFPKNHVIVKTEITQDITRLVIENKVLQAISYTDRLFSLIVSFSGNMKVLPMLFCLRLAGPRLIDKPEIQQELNSSVGMGGLTKREVLCPVVDYFIKKANRSENEWEKVMLATKSLMEKHFQSPTSGELRKEHCGTLSGERLDIMEIERLIKVGEDEIKEIFIDFRKRKLVE